MLAPPEKVARAIWRATFSRRPVIYPTWSAWFMAWVDRYLEPLSRIGNLVYRDRVLALRDEPTEIAGETEAPKLEQA